MDTAHTEAVQAVVDRLTSYQDGAPEGTVERELRKALGETDVALDEQQITMLADAITKADEPVKVEQVLG